MNVCFGGLHGHCAPGGAVGRVGVPHYEAISGAQPMFYNNAIVAGGPAPTRAYIDELLPDVMEGPRMQRRLR